MTATFFSKRNLLIALVASLLMFTSVLAYSFAGKVYAEDIKSNLCGGAGLTLSSADCEGGGECLKRNDEGKCIEFKSESNLNKLIANIVNIITVIVGIIAVIMIIFGGFKYITSGGDSGSISSAKNTIIYAIVGLIIVALAQVIVRFILNKTT